MTNKRATGRPARRSGTGRLFRSLVVVALLGTVGFVGTRAAISDTTDNPGNEFNAGTIDLVDNDAGTYMYQVDNAQPGDSVSRCIRVSYTGTLDSTVKLFMTTPIDTLGPYVDMSVDVGTQASSSFPDCTGFSSTANLYTGTLSGFQTTHPDVASGLAYSPNGASPWTDGDSVVYRVTLTLQNSVRSPGEDFSGMHTYSWEADTV
jgi:hypothetical protein